MRSILLFSLVGTAVLLAVRSYERLKVANRPLCKRCNIVFIDIDDLRIDALPCTGYRLDTTPNMCALAQKGAFFLRNISQSHWTLPSMMSTITSTYPSTHDVLVEEHVLHPGLTTLASYLKKLGYATVFQGASDDFSIREKNGGTRGFDKVLNEKKQYMDYRSDAQIPPYWVDSWLEALQLAQKREPFFLHLYSYAPHVPFLREEGQPYIENLPKPPGFPETPEEFDVLMKTYIKDHYLEIFTPSTIEDHPELFSDVPGAIDAIYEYYLTTDKRFLTGRWQHIMNAYVGSINRTGDPARAYVRMLYDTILSDVDRVVGQIIASIERSSYAANTVIVISSSHGEEFGDHGYYSHDQGNYNELIHTPLIISVPNFKHQKIHQVTENIDIVPTLVEIIGGPPLEQFQGKSLVAYLRGQALTGKQYAISEFTVPNRGASIQSDRWKLILSAFDTASESSVLYNLLDDPHETNNLAIIDEGRVKRLSRMLKSRLEKARANRFLSYPRAVPTWIDESVQERLKKGGYF